MKGMIIEMGEEFKATRALDRLADEYRSIPDTISDPSDRFNGTWAKRDSGLMVPTVCDRRGFLSLAVGGAVMLTLPSANVRAEGQSEEAIWAVLPWVEKFSIAIGAQVLSSTIALYTDKLANWLQVQVAETNGWMRQAGFRNFDQAKVWGHVGSGGSFFYPALRSDGNVCIAIHGYDGPLDRAQRVTFEGPSVVGVARASELIIRHVQDEKGLTVTQAKSLARNVLQPTEALARNGTATFLSSYRNADRYRTKKGELTINYTSNGTDKGKVHVISETISPRTVIWESTHSLTDLV